MKRSLLLAVGAACGIAGLAHAQANTAYGPDNGFFRPSPDVSLTAPRAAGGSPQAAQQPFLTITTPQAMPATVAPVAVPAAVTVVPSTVPGRSAAMSATPNAAMMSAAGNPAAGVPPASAAMSSTAAPADLPPPAAAQAWTERQMDRSENEADRARVQMQATTPGVGAAFDGTTSAENR